MFQNLKSIPLDEVFRLFAEYNTDTREYKVNLGIGLCHDKDGKLYQLQSVKKAYKNVNVDDFSYAPIWGNLEYLKHSADLILHAYDPDKLAMQASTGGSHALRLIADLLTKDGEYKNLLIGKPSWNNHLALFKNMNIEQFDHLDNKWTKASLKNYIQAAESAKPWTILLLHGWRAHNPTGINLDKKELVQLIPYLQKHNIYLIVDFAYFWLGESIGEAREWLQLIYDNLNDFAVTFSYSKNAGLYEMRTGLLFIKTEHKHIVESQLRQLCRESVSNSPGIGQEMIADLLKNEKTEWLGELEAMRKNCERSRDLLVWKLPSEFSYLGDCAGLFGLLHLSHEQIDNLKTEYGIYMLSNGRINFTGITEENVDYVVKAISSIL